jgi:hypothetical protein
MGKANLRGANRAVRAALSLAVLAGTMTAAPRPAGAACYDAQGNPSTSCTPWTGQDWIFVVDAFAAVAALGGLFPGYALLKTTPAEPPNDTFAAAFYAFGGSAVGLAGLGAGIQAGAGCARPDDCKASYGMAAGSAALGLVWIGLGVYVSVTVHRPRRYVLAPAPLLLHDARGRAAPGLALAGLGF